MAYLSHNLALRAKFGVHNHIGLLIKWLALGKHLANGIQGVFPLKQGSVALMFGSLVNGLCLGPQAHE